MPKKTEKAYGKGTGTLHPADIHVSGRVRLRRTLLGLSQAALGEAIGITFQQLQNQIRMMRDICVVTVLLSVFAAISPATAENLPIEAFLGHWSGSAVGQRTTTPNFKYEVRDLDVTITGSERGFEITWITVIRSSGTAEQPKVARRSTAARFVRLGPSRFEARDSRDAGSGDSRSWARIEARSLIVYIFEIDREGIYDLSRYVRTISTSGVMGLDFTRLRDGATVRRVTGSLLKGTP